MNRRELLKSSATLAAAVVGCIPQETKPVVILKTRLSGDCRVDCQCSGYPPARGDWFFIDEPTCNLKAVTDEIWRQHRLADLPDPKIVPGWSHFRVPSGT